MSAEGRQVTGRQIVIFRLDQEEFGIDIRTVREIMKVPTVTSLPDMVEFVEGIIELRGEIIPVFDLRRRFDMGGDTTEESTRIIIINLKGDLSVGVIVDAVEEVLTLEQEDIKEIADTIGQRCTDFIEGIGSLDDRMIIMLNMEEVLTTEEKLALEEVVEDL